MGDRIGGIRIVAIGQRTLAAGPVTARRRSSPHVAPLSKMDLPFDGPSAGRGSQARQRPTRAKWWVSTVKSTAVGAWAFLQASVVPGPVDSVIVPLGLAEVRDGLLGTGDENAVAIVRAIRLPRLTLAIIVGALVLPTLPFIGVSILAPAAGPVDAGSVLLAVPEQLGERHVHAVVEVVRPLPVEAPAAVPAEDLLQAVRQDDDAESGRGLSLMRALVDNLNFVSEPKVGAVVHMVKRLDYDQSHPFRRTDG